MIDIDSAIAGVHSDAMGDGTNGHGVRLGCHPLVASRNDTGEIVHGRARKGSRQRGGARFTAESLRRVRCLAPGAEPTVRADAGFFSWDLINTLDAGFLVAVAAYPTIESPDVLPEIRPRHAEPSPSAVESSPDGLLGASACASCVSNHAPTPPEKERADDATREARQPGFGSLWFVMN